jgi:hypothetical protein
MSDIGRLDLRDALDLLAQHAVTVALGGGFCSDELRLLSITRKYPKFCQNSERSLIISRPTPKAEYAAPLIVLQDSCP